MYESYTSRRVVIGQGNHRPRVSCETADGYFQKKVSRYFEVNGTTKREFLGHRSGIFQVCSTCKTLVRVASLYDLFSKLVTVAGRLPAAHRPAASKQLVSRTCDSHSPLSYTRIKEVHCCRFDESECRLQCNGKTVCLCFYAPVAAARAHLRLFRRFICVFLRSFLSVSAAAIELSAYLLRAALYDLTYICMYRLGPAALVASCENIRRMPSIFLSATDRSAIICINRHKTRFNLFRLVWLTYLLRHGCTHLRISFILCTYLLY